MNYNWCKYTIFGQNLVKFWSKLMCLFVLFNITNKNRSACKALVFNDISTMIVIFTKTNDNLFSGTGIPTTLNR